MAFQCSLCPKMFKLRHQLERHLACIHVGEGKHVCTTCQRSFSRKDALLRHERKHTVEERTFPCEMCDSVFLRKDNLLRHLKTHDEHPRKRKRTSATEVTMPQTAERTAEIPPHVKPSSEPVDQDREHHISEMPIENEQVPTAVFTDSPHADTGPVVSTSVGCQQDPIKYPGHTSMPEAMGYTENCDPEDVNKLYQKQWSDIRTKFQTKGKVKHTFNFRLQTMTMEELTMRGQQIFDRQSTAFKINVGFGFILRNVETCELQYYYASHNTKLLPEPELITNRESLVRFLNHLSMRDPLEHVRQARPNSRWVVELITNAMFYVYRLREHPIGGTLHTLPDFVTNNKAVISLQRNWNGVHYHDNLCFFRCLALHKGTPMTALEKKTKELYRQMYTTSIPKFKGISLSELHDVEELYKLNIVVYGLVEATEDSDTDNESPDTPSTIVARLAHRSLERYKESMYLNLCGDHFSYIKDIEAYTKSYQCRKCLKLWKHRGMLNRHESSCDGVGVKHTFPGGVYVQPKAVFELLDDEGIHIPVELRYHPHRAVFDFESYFEKVPAKDDQESKLTWEARHIPLSASVCSNVPEYEDPICFVSDGNSEDLLEKMLAYISEVSERSYSLLYDIYSPYIRRISSRIEAERKEFEELSRKRERHARPRQHYLQALLDRLTAYISELPVIGFNSGSYDINLVKEYLFPWLVENDPLKFIVKRNNTYMAVKSKNLLFLDITNFIAPGFSYDAFLKAYGCSQQKGFFPYEWINLQNIHDTQLPPHDSFFSTLKKANITSEEYAHCQQVWRQEGMETMTDFLKWYNNLDVVPFLEALDKMVQFYKERQIDVFKDGISVPGLTLKYLFQMANGEPFALFSEKDKDLYYTFRRNQVGGPSIIFHRYQEAGKTMVRGTENVCQRIVGFDANALYLWAIMQEMPTGPFVRRKEETGFKREKSKPVSIEWLEWCAHRDNVHIRHNWNDKEKRVGVRRIPVDGFCQETNTVYQFHGCYWHGHDCHLTTNKGLTANEEQLLQERKRRTKEIRGYIENLGYNYEEILECEYYRVKDTSPELKEFVHSLQRPLERTCRLNPETIVRAIRDDLLFGVIECDIHVPEELKPKFAEMCPIFKNTEISIDDIGDHMKTFAEEGNIMSKPRRSLIGSMFGEKILLATPLVKWYLDHGLKITNVYQVVEFTPKQCFKTFGEAVSDARREGDKDPAKAIIADTMKLIGNSSYGKTITNKENHRNVSLVNDDKATRLVNNITFRDLNEISPRCYEIESAKKSIAMDLPLQIGFFVYQYAKMRMLQFYYDFLDRYFDRSHWEYVEMDTDSAYIAIAARTLDELVKPEAREAYNQDKHNWFPRDDTDEHKRYDKRTPGLFKVEWEGDGIVALNSKMYYCFGGAKDKFSCKGMNKKQNDVRKDTYLDVLKTKSPQIGENKGFRVKDNRVYTYSQLKSGFTYFYPKRKVMDNGVQTTYLDI